MLFKRLFVTSFLASGLVACANSPAPNKYQQLASSSYLAPTGADQAKHSSFTYEAPGGGLARYKRVYLAPITVYAGADQQFGSLSAADKAELATFADEQFRAALSRYGILAASRDRDAAELKITLTGGQATIPVVATATKLTPAGFAMNTVTALTDGEGRFNGVIIYAVEFRDAPSGKILWAFVTKQYPNALNLAATILPLDAAKEGLKQGAEKLAKATATRLGG